MRDLSTCFLRWRGKPFARIERFGQNGLSLELGLCQRSDIKSADFS